MIEVMSEPGLRERKKARTRRAILQATLRLVQAQGYDATTVEQIAAEAEVSPSTFFRYFPTKEDAILEDEYDPLIVAALGSQAADLPPLEAARRAFGELFGTIYERDRDQLYLRMRLWIEVPAIRARMADSMRDAEDLMAAAMARQLGHDEVGFDVQMAAAAVMGTMGRAIVIWAQDGGTGDLPAMLDRALALLQGGLELR